jgi:hypothetical protein
MKYVPTLDCSYGTNNKPLSDPQSSTSLI